MDRIIVDVCTIISTSFVALTFFVQHLARMKKTASKVSTWFTEKKIVLQEHVLF